LPCASARLAKEGGLLAAAEEALEELEEARVRISTICPSLERERYLPEKLPKAWRGAMFARGATHLSIDAVNLSFGRLTQSNTLISAPFLSAL